MTSLRSRKVKKRVRALCTVLEGGGGGAYVVRVTFDCANSTATFGDERRGKFDEDLYLFSAHAHTQELTNHVVGVGEGDKRRRWAAALPFPLSDASLSTLRGSTKCFSLADGTRCEGRTCQRCLPTLIPRAMVFLSSYMGQVMIENSFL